MTRNLKTLGLALVAIFAMSAAVASVASAASDTFTAEAGLAKLTGKQETGAGKNKFTVAGQAVECETATFSASKTGTDFTEVAGIVPFYGDGVTAGQKCNYGLNAATVHVNGCTYTLKGATHVNGASETHATAEVICPAGKHIEVTIPAINCIITVKAAAASNGTQVATNGYTITTVGTGTTRELTGHLTATVKVSNDTLDKLVADTLACNNIVGNGVLTGTVEVTGETSGGVHVGIFDNLV